MFQNRCLNLLPSIAKRLDLRVVLVGLIRRCKGVISSFRFLFRNFVVTRKLFLFHKVEFGEIVIRAFSPSDFEDVDRIYKFFEQHGLGRDKKWLLRLLGQRLCVVAEHQGYGVVGFVLFYFNPRDVQEGTVHEGFQGVLPDYQGKKIATRLHQHAIQHFVKNGLVGFSARISFSNAVAMKFDHKLGYRIVEKYFDNEMNEERGYFRLIFSDNKLL